MRKIRIASSRGEGGGGPVNRVYGVRASATRITGKEHEKCNYEGETVSEDVSISFLSLEMGRTFVYQK